MESYTECLPCSRNDKSAAADKWCVDCEDSLCKICVTAHRGNKASMRHHIIDLQAATMLIGDTLASQRQCPSHQDFTMDFFCTHHDVLCCRHCMSVSHRSCDKVVPLEIACKGAKNSTLYRDITDEMKQIRSTRNRIIQNDKETKQRICYEEKNIVNKISEAKESLIKKLNQKETFSLSELRDARNNIENTVDNQVADSEASVAEIDKYSKQLDILTTNGTDQHVFLRLRELQSIVSKQRECLEKLVSKLSEPHLIFQQPTDVFSECKGLGSISIQQERSSMQYSPRKHIQAQIVSTAGQFPKSFKFDSRINIDNGQVSGLTTDNSGNLIMTIHNRLLLYSENGRYIKECKLSGEAWDVSFHPKSGNVVVALQSGGLQLVHNFSTEPAIKFKNCIVGIAYGKDNICAGDSKGILHFFSFDVRHVKKVPIGGKGALYYIHCRNDKIYISESTSNVIHCLHNDGSHFFKISPLKLSMPDGISSDRQGNVYVVGRESDNIHRLSADGKKNDIILGSDDGIKDPYTICFSKDYGKLFVSNENGTSIFVYDCQY
ncbi:uncharacterized protein LOC143076461 [Mytilus galloprovincialis]|uniref:uncharacterized protein LOC143076461 n=1 Tax=Mytilus galloprovincialis TaxID=29158 RepID=UPI003F7BB054